MQQIRLPFGRNKDKKKKEKHDPPPMPPPHFLSPVAEPTGDDQSSGTPAAGDDSEPVKQLCAMGFSRSNVVAALERESYDMRKALDRLVGENRA